MPIGRVEQIHDSGCAVACVAMLAGVSYTRASLVVKGRRRGNLAAFWPEVIRGLRSLGLRCRMGADFMKKGLPAVLMFEWPTARGEYHCVVYDPEDDRFIDPAHSPCLGRDFYMRQWRRNGRESVVVTGRR